jgi:hypothetical protein
MGSAAVRETVARLLDAPRATSPGSRVPGYAVAGSLSYGVLNRGTVAQVDRCEGLSHAPVWSARHCFPNAFSGGSHPASAAGLR